MARGLTQQLLTFSKGGTPILKVTALPDLIRDAARPAVSGSQVRCDFQLAEDLWPVIADEGQIGQVVRNMVFNAREAMPNGGGISIRAENVTRRTPEMPALPAGGYVRVSIADRGVGIPAEVLPSIFDPYFSTKERGERKGMGLGLTICHTIVQKHGGAITVKSVPGEGSTFDVYLPAAPKAKNAAVVPVPQATTSRHKILVMDDEQTVRDVCGKTLRRMGHEVAAVGEGKQAVEAYAAAKKAGRPFDAVLLDLTIRDGMGGRAAFQALREIDPEVKAIVMSGYADDPVVEQYGSHGFVGALVKPFDIERLRRVLTAVLAEAKL
ncbi:MAG: response regulator [Opitutaceae bacterium]|nr:response regulator [Opitutaceae bacterium]